MLHYKYLILFSIILIPLATLNAQAEIGFGNANENLDSDYVKSSKSKKLNLGQGESYELKLRMKAGRAYYISVKGRKAGQNVQYRIKKPAEPVQNSQEKILYDNSLFNFRSDEFFRPRKDMEVILEIYSQAGFASADLRKETKVNLFIAGKYER